MIAVDQFIAVFHRPGADLLQGLLPGRKGAADGGNIAAIQIGQGQQAKGQSQDAAQPGSGLLQHQRRGQGQQRIVGKEIHRADPKGSDQGGGGDGGDAEQQQPPQVGKGAGAADIPQLQNHSAEQQRQLKGQQQDEKGVLRPGPAKAGHIPEGHINIRKALGKIGRGRIKDGALVHGEEFHKKQAGQIGSSIGQGAEQGQLPPVEDRPPLRPEAKQQLQTLKGQDGQHHNTGLPQALHPGGKTQQQGQSQGQRPQARVCHAARIVPQHHKESDKVAGVIAAQDEQQLAHLLIHQLVPKGAGHQHQRGAGKADPPLHHGAQQPEKAEHDQGAHHRGGQGHGGVGAAGEAIEQGGKHRGCHYIKLVAEHIAQGKQALLLPHHHGHQGVGIHILLAEAGKAFEIDHGKNREVAGHDQ